MGNNKNTRLRIVVYKIS